MKTSTLFILAVSVNAAAAFKFIDGPRDWYSAVGFDVTQKHDHELPHLMARVVTPKRQDMKTRNPHIPNSKTVKIRYGPYTVPGASRYD
jgi:hypothetical protein